MAQPPNWSGKESTGAVKPPVKLSQLVADFLKDKELDPNDDYYRERALAAQHSLYEYGMALIFQSSPYADQHSAKMLHEILKPERSRLSEAITHALKVVFRVGDQVVREWREKLQDEHNLTGTPADGPKLSAVIDEFMADTCMSHNEDVTQRAYQYGMTRLFQESSYADAESMRITEHLLRPQGSPLSEALTKNLHIAPQEADAMVKELDQQLRSLIARTLAK